MNFIQMLRWLFVDPLSTDPRKSMYDLHPEAFDREHLLRLNSEEEQAACGGYQGFQQAATDYNTRMWVQKAINVKKNNFAPLPLRVATGANQTLKYTDSHPALDLLNTPNPEMSAEDLWSEWSINMDLAGEIGFEVVRNSGRSKVLELWPRNSETIIIHPKSYRYRSVASYTIRDGIADPYPLAAEDLIFFKYYNPIMPFRGIAPIVAVKLSIIIDQLAQAWSRLFFRNSARPDYAIIAPEGITPSEKKELIAKLTQEHNLNHAHEPIVLEEGVTDVKSISLPAKDTEWLAQREFARDEIGAVFGVPDEIMGYGRDTYENFATAEKVFWTLTLQPLWGLRDGGLTRGLRRLGLLNPNERIETDYSRVPQLQEDKTAKVEQLDKLASRGYPINTVNDWLGLGLPHVDGGDQGYISVTLVPMGQERPQVTPPAPPKAMTKSYKDFGSIEHEVLYKSRQSRLDSFSDELRRTAKREFQRQQNEIGQKLRSGKTWGRGAHKDDNDYIPPVEELFDVTAEAELFKIAFKPPTQRAVAYVATLDLASLGIDIAYDITRPEVQAAIAGILQTVSTKTNQTTWTDLVDLFQEAERNGEGIPKIQERLSEYFGQRKSDYETERIARTTLTGASNAGTHDAGMVAQDEGRQINHVWLSALLPDRSRETHMAAHGQTVPLTQTFDVGGESLMYPGDPQGSPDNIINCLCNEILEDVG